MKINEPKTPYAKHYDPAEDPSDADEEEDAQSEDAVMADGSPSADAAAGRKERKAYGGPGGEDDIPGLSLGEPEEEVPEDEFAPRRASAGKREKAVQVDDAGSGHDDDEMVGLSAEEREKHRRFKEMRSRHYEMKNVAHLLGHPEVLDDDDDEEVPPLPGRPMNGSA